jgi:hypothetical protein
VDLLVDVDEQPPGGSDVVELEGEKRRLGAEEEAPSA